MQRRLRQWLLSVRVSPQRALLVFIVAGCLTPAGIFGGRYYWAEHQTKAAERALELRDYDEAQRRLDSALQIRPDSGRLHFLAARTARRAGRYEDVRPRLTAALNLGYPEDAIRLEQALLDLQQGDRWAEGNLRRRVEEDDPDSLLILEVLIQDYVQTFQLDKAMRCFNLYLQKKPDDVQALLGRAKVSELLFYYADAVLDCRRAVEVEPENGYSRLRLAEMLVITGPAREAVEQFEQLQGEKPKSAPVLLGLARARMQLGEVAAARRDLDLLLQEEPRNAAALSERGKADLTDGKAAEAEPWLRRALTEAPYDRQTVSNFVKCLDALGKAEEADEWRAKLKIIDVDMARLAAVTKEVIQSPNDPALRTEAGVLYLRNGQEDEGRRWLLMALKLQPRYAPAHRALADYFREHGQPSLADQHERLAGPVQP
jgi:tetratricopeptide (TPR) repeat protein